MSFAEKLLRLSHLHQEKAEYEAARFTYDQETGLVKHGDVFLFRVNDPIRGAKLANALNTALGREILAVQSDLDAAVTELKSQEGS